MGENQSQSRTKIDNGRERNADESNMENGAHYPTDYGSVNHQLIITSNNTIDFQEDNSKMFKRLGKASSDDDNLINTHNSSEDSSDKVSHSLNYYRPDSSTRANMVPRNVFGRTQNQKKGTERREECKQNVETEKTKETRSSEQEIPELRNNIQEVTSSCYSEKERILQQKRHTTETTFLQERLEKQERKNCDMQEDMTGIPCFYTKKNVQHSNKVSQLQTLEEAEQEMSELERKIDAYDAEIKAILAASTVTEKQLLDKVLELTGKWKDVLKEKEKKLKEKLRETEEAALEASCEKQIHEERIQKLEQLVEQKERENNEIQHKNESIILKLVKENKTMADNLTNIQAHLRQKRIDSERTNEEIQKIVEEREKIMEQIKEFTNHLQTLKQERELMDIVMQVSTAALGDRFQMMGRQIRQLQEIIDNDRKQFTEERKAYTDQVEELKAQLTQQNHLLKP